MLKYLLFLFLSLFYFNSRNECTEQCLKRKRDLENETRDIRRLLNDKDERIKILDNELKVSSFTQIIIKNLHEISEKKLNTFDISF